MANEPNSLAANIEFRTGRCGGSCGDCTPPLACGAAGLCVDPDLGNICSTPYLVDGLPFIAIGDTQPATDNYDFGSYSCPGENYSHGTTSDDEVYLFTPPADGNYQIAIDPENFNAAIHPDRGLPFVDPHGSAGVALRDISVEFDSESALPWLRQRNRWWEAYRPWASCPRGACLRKIHLPASPSHR